MRVSIKCEVSLLVLVCGLQLASTEEFVDGAFTGNLREVLIRYGAYVLLGGCISSVSSLSFLYLQMQECYVPEGCS